MELSGRLSSSFTFFGASNLASYSFLSSTATYQQGRGTYDWHENSEGRVSANDIHENLEKNHEQELVERSIAIQNVKQNDDKDHE